MDWLFQYSDPSLDWGYAMTTLLIRFIGVFVVMFVMQVFLQASARAVAWIEGRGAARPPDAPPAAQPAAEEPRTGDLDATSIDPRVVAAIGLALQLESRQSRRRPPATAPPSPWAMAGRMAQLRGWPR